MEPILDCTSERVAHTKNRSFRREEKKSICDWSRFNQMPQTDYITEIAPCVRVCKDV